MVERSGPAMSSPFDEDATLGMRIALERQEIQEYVESEVADREAANTTLGERLGQLGGRSIPVTVTVGSATLTGIVTHVGKDVATLTVNGGDRYVVAFGVVQVGYRNEPAAPAIVRSGEPHTMIAHLRELWNLDRSVELTSTDGSIATGTVLAVTSSHLELGGNTGARHLVPIQRIAWLRLA